MENFARAARHTLTSPTSGHLRHRPQRSRSQFLKGSRTALPAGVGVVTIAVGAALDIGHHAGLALLASEGLGEFGHLLTFLGMVIIAVAAVLTVRH